MEVQTEGACSFCGESLGSEPLTIGFRKRQRSFCTFLCAIRSLAPVCQSCGTIILGRGYPRGAGIACGIACARRLTPE